MNPQLNLLRNEPKAYGGELLKTRKARSRGRPLDTRNTMHLVLRSSKARGEWSFKHHRNESKIRGIVARFSNKYGIKILSLANVGNHLHFQIKLGNRYAYRPFIRAITAAIAMSVTGVSRWNKDWARGRDPGNPAATLKALRFWDYRPFTRVIQSFKAVLNLRDYLRINQLEGYGMNRSHARLIVGTGSFRKFGDSS